MFEEARATKNLDFAFNTTVEAVTDEEERGISISVNSQECGKRKFRGHKAVCTLPMNVANKVKFSPELPPMKREAFESGHVNKGLKVHSIFTENGIPLRTVDSQER